MSEEPICSHPTRLQIIAAGSYGPTLSFWVDDDLSVGGSGAAGGLGDGYLKANDIGHYLHLPKDALNVRFGQFELDLPFTQARTINLSDYDIYDAASVAPPNLLCSPIRHWLLGDTLHNEQSAYVWSSSAGH